MACLITGFKARFECYSCSHCWCRSGDLGKQFSDLPVPVTLDGVCCLVVHKVYITALNLRATLGSNAALWLPYSSSLPCLVKKEAYCIPSQPHAWWFYFADHLPLQTASSFPLLSYQWTKRQILLFESQVSSQNSLSCKVESCSLIGLRNQTRTSVFICKWLIASTSDCCQERLEICDDYHCGCYLGLNLGTSKATSLKLYSWN